MRGRGGGSTSCHNHARRGRAAALPSSTKRRPIAGSENDATRRAQLYTMRAQTHTPQHSHVAELDVEGGEDDDQAGADGVEGVDAAGAGREGQHASGVRARACVRPCTAPGAARAPPYVCLVWNISEKVAMKPKTVRASCAAGAGVGVRVWVCARACVHGMVAGGASGANGAAQARARGMQGHRAGGVVAPVHASVPRPPPRTRQSTSPGRSGRLQRGGRARAGCGANASAPGLHALAEARSLPPMARRAGRQAQQGVGRAAEELSQSLRL